MESMTSIIWRQVAGDIHSQHHRSIFWEMLILPTPILITKLFKIFLREYRPIPSVDSAVKKKDGSYRTAEITWWCLHQLLFNLHLQRHQRLPGKYHSQLSSPR